MATTRLHVKLIGCGGIGGHLAPNLCQYLHAERRAAHVVLVDGDTFEERNRSRMRFATCENKALVTARDLARAFGDVLTIEPRPEYVTAENIDTLVGDGDVVFLAVDNHATRRLVDTRCARLDDATLISGGNDGVDEGHDGTYGNVQIVRRAGGRAVTSTLSRFHPEIRAPRDRRPDELSCTELAHAGAPQLLFTNLAVASAMLNAFYALQRGEPKYEEVFLDILKNSVVPVVRTS
jgi:molybdopterin/thiamine biosynthesis adenylyltransferase